MGETIKFSEFRKKCFCNSDYLLDKVFIIGDEAMEWVGFGMVPLRIDPDPEKHVTVLED